MKITFQFDNGTSRVILEPEGVRDERYLELCRENKPVVEIDSASKPKALVIAFRQSKVTDSSNISSHLKYCICGAGLTSKCPIHSLPPGPENSMGIIG